MLKNLNTPVRAYRFPQKRDEKLGEVSRDRKEKRMKDFLKAVLDIVVPLLVITILGLSIALSIKYACAKQDDRKYNGGICTKCGGHYIYEQAVAHAYDTDYIYICDKCGHMIELESYRLQEGEEE